MTLKRGQIIELRVQSAAFEGKAVGRKDGMVVFVPFAVPGDLVRARIVRRKKRYLEATVEEILEPSPDRVKPRCKHFTICGGCTLQNAQYARQLEYKREQVSALLERIGGIDGVVTSPTIPSCRPYFYRNKMEFSFGANRWLTREEIESGRELQKGFALGLHIPGRFDKILDLEDCFLQGEITPRIVNWVREYCLERGWTAYHSRKHTGYLRNLIIRMGVRTGDIMANLVTSRFDRERAETFAGDFRAAFPELTTLLNTINATRSPLSAGEEVVLFGSGMLRERVGDLLLEISATAFFQPNSVQAEVLCSTIAGLACLRQDQIVYDLYCGIGAIGLFLSRSVGKVVGVESHPQSVALARRNASLNQIENCEFHNLDVADALKAEAVRTEGVPDVVIFDPPRVGLHPKVCKRVLQLRPPRVIYTSCNPATQARDLQILAADYVVEAVQPVDMFPQTYHIENVVALRRRG